MAEIGDPAVLDLKVYRDRRAAQPGVRLGGCIRRIKTRQPRDVGRKRDQFLVVEIVEHVVPVICRVVRTTFRTAVTDHIRDRGACAIPVCRNGAGTLTPFFKPTGVRVAIRNTVRPPVLKDKTEWMQSSNP